MFKALRTARIVSSGLLSSKDVISRLDFRVGALDCDFNRHLTNSKYPMYMDYGRWDIMVRSGAIRLCIRKRLTPVVVEMNLTFRRELPYGTPFTLDTRIVSADRRIITFEQIFFVDETPHFRAQVRSLVLQRGQVVHAGEFAEFVTQPYDDHTSGP